MNETIHMGNSSQLIMKEQKNPGVIGTTPYSQNIFTVLFTFYDKVSIGSIALLTKHYSDDIIVVDDGSSNRNAAIPRKAGVKVSEDSFLQENLLPRR